MVTFNEYTINKNNVSFMITKPDGTYDVYMNNGTIINVDEATFNALKYINLCIDYGKKKK